MPFRLSQPLSQPLGYDFERQCEDARGRWLWDPAQEEPAPAEWPDWPALAAEEPLTLPEEEE